MANAMTTREQESVLYSEHPSMFRSQPISFLILCLLIPLVIGAIGLFFWWLKAIGTTLTITNRRTTLRKGILSKEESEVLHCNVRNVVLKQTMFQRMMGTGYLAISSSGQSDLEIEVHGIPLPSKAKKLIDQNR